MSFNKGLSMSLPAVPTTKILAIGTLNVPREESAHLMRAEVPATVLLYFEGKIDQWFTRQDRPGVVFILNVSSLEEANRLLEALPLGQHKMMSFELFPLGPLKQLGVIMPVGAS